MFCLAGCSTDESESLVLNQLFSSGAVLQRGQEIPVFGLASPGATVTVDLEGVSASTQAGADGQWLASLPARDAGGPFELKVRSGDTEIRLEDILVGDVFLLGGQSNMDLYLAQTTNGGTLAATLNDVGLRQFRLLDRLTDVPQRDAPTAEGWLRATPENNNIFSALGWHLGRELRANQQVPIGLIEVSRGSSTAECWTSREALQNVPALRYLLDLYPHAVANGQDVLNDATFATLGYNGMVAPVIPYGIRAVAFYQGESNRSRAAEYPLLFSTLIRDWRARWDRELPFLFVQLSGFGVPTEAVEESDWAQLREAQRLVSLTESNVAMIVSIDHGSTDIHSPDKEPIGHRLALAALGLVYEQGTEWRGPTLEGAVSQGSFVTLRFSHVGSGLQGSARNFKLAGADGNFFPASAVITAPDQLTLSSPQVPSPRHVRYAWNQAPVTDLFDSRGLPASPFGADL